LLVLLFFLLFLEKRIASFFSRRKSKKEAVGPKWARSSTAQMVFHSFGFKSPNSPLHSRLQCEQDDTDGDGSQYDSTGSANQTNPPNTKNPRTSSDFKFPRQSSPPEMEAARESMAALLDAGLFASAQTLVRAAIPVSPPLPSSQPSVHPALESLGFCLESDVVRARAGGSGSKVFTPPGARAVRTALPLRYEQGWVAASGNGARFCSAN